MFLYFIGTLDFLHLLVFYLLGYLSLLSNFFVYAQSFSHVSLFETPWTAAYQAPPSMGFPGKYWNTGVGCHCLLWNYSLEYAKS